MTTTALIYNKEYTDRYHLKTGREVFIPSLKLAFIGTSIFEQEEPNNTYHSVYEAREITSEISEIELNDEFVQKIQEVARQQKVVSDLRETLDPEIEEFWKNYPPILEFLPVDEYNIEESAWCNIL